MIESTFLNYKDIQPGMIAQDIYGSLFVIIKKGTAKELKDFFIGGQASLSDWNEIPELAIECVAVVELSKESSFDFKCGDSYVYSYGNGGIYARRKNRINKLLLRP